MVYCAGFGWFCLLVCFVIRWDLIWLWFTVWGGWYSSCVVIHVGWLFVVWLLLVLFLLRLLWLFVFVVFWLLQYCSVCFGYWIMLCLLMFRLFGLVCLWCFVYVFGWWIGYLWLLRLCYGSVAYCCWVLFGYVACDTLHCLVLLVCIAFVDIVVCFVSLRWVGLCCLVLLIVLFMCDKFVVLRV